MSDLSIEIVVGVVGAVAAMGATCLWRRWMGGRPEYPVEGTKRVVTPYKLNNIPFLGSPVLIFLWRQSVRIAAYSQIYSTANIIGGRAKVNHIIA